MLQLLVFDARRGNTEGQEDDKVLAGFPAGVPILQQSSLAGLLQGLLLFTANFTAAERPSWELAETDTGTWVLHEAEPHIWMAALSPRDWLPRHATEHNLRSLLHQAHLLVTVLCGTVQSLLDQDPSGSLARTSLQPVLQLIGQQLCSTHTWQHRELRNPLMDVSMPPLLQLPPTAALAVQSLGSQLLQAALPGGWPIQGVMLLYGPHLLWSSLGARDTAAVFALIATGLIHASSGGSGGSNGSSNGGSARSSAAALLGAGSRSAAAAAAGGPPPLPHLRPLEGSSWQQLPSGYLVQRGSLNAAVTGGSQAIQVPVVHLMHPAGSDNPQQQEGQQAQQQQQQCQQQGDTYHLLPLLEGRLLVVMLVGSSTPLTSSLLAALHSWVAAPAKQLTSLVGEELKAGKVESGHLPGFRYLYQDTEQGVVRCTPRVKISAMTHHARVLAAAVRESLGGGLLHSNGSLAGGEEGEAAAEGGQGGSGSSAGAAAPAAHQQGRQGEEWRRHCQGDSRVLEVAAKSSQDCWAAAWRPTPTRQLLAVRERKTEKDLMGAAEVMQEFAEQNFLI